MENKREQGHKLAKCNRSCSDHDTANTTKVNNLVTGDCTHEESGELAASLIQVLDALQTLPQFADHLTSLTS